MFSKLKRAFSHTEQEYLHIDTVAKYLINKEPMNYLKLQGLLFYIQCFHLSIYNKPLFKQRFESWTHGAVSPYIDNKYRQYHYVLIPNQEEFFEIKESKRNFIEGVRQLFKEYDGRDMKHFVLQEEAWIYARDGLPSHSPSHKVISHVLMKKCGKRYLIDKSIE